MANPFSSYDEIDIQYEREKAATSLAGPVGRMGMFSRIADQQREIIAAIDSGDHSRTLSAVNRFYDHQDNVHRRTKQRDLVGTVALGGIVGAGLLSTTSAVSAGAAATDWGGLEIATSAGQEAAIGTGALPGVSTSSAVGGAGALTKLATDFGSGLLNAAKTSVMSQTLDKLGLSPSQPSGPTTTRVPTGQSSGNPMDMIYNLFGDSNSSAPGSAFGLPLGGDGEAVGFKPGLGFIVAALVAIFGVMFFLRR